MRVTIELNGVKVEKEIPIKWKEVTFSQFLKLSKMKETSEILSMFLGIEEETLKKAKIHNLETILSLLSFLKEEMDLQVPDTCMGYKIPKNLELETIGQFEDLKLEAQDLKDFEKYALFCGIYASEPYDYKKAEELKEVFMNAPCEEVMAIGNFTLLKLVELTSGIKPKSSSRNTPMTKFRRVLTVWVRSLVFMVRFYTWKRKLRLTERSY